jgi:hypothetical protein
MPQHGPPRVLQMAEQSEEELSSATSWKKLRQTQMQQRLSHFKKPAHLLIFLDQEQLLRETSRQPMLAILQPQTCVCPTLRSADDSSECSTCIKTLQRAVIAAADDRIARATFENHNQVPNGANDSYYTDSKGQVWEAT